MVNFNSLAISLFLLCSAYSAPLVINTPAKLVSNTPTLITWSGGTAPFFLEVLPGDSPSSAPLVDLGETVGPAFVWNTDVAKGTVIEYEIKDAAGSIALSAPVVVE